MKNKILIVFIIFFFNVKALAENLIIEAKNIILDKDKVSTIFENQVVVKSEDKIFKSEYVKYNKKSGYLVLKDNVEVTDKKNNIITTNHAEYFEFEKIFKTTGVTGIKTSQNYLLEGEDIVFDNKNKKINSEKSSIINDIDGNKIYLQNFEYDIQNNIFKSLSLTKINDKNQNEYKFSQIYIDTKKKEILGTDVKAFLNQENLKINKKNKPRVFSNTIKLGKETSVFNKSIFTLCDYRENDKCPPWTIQSSEMLHDNKKKTIYYDNAVVKVYDIPIFYFPKLSHPDPTVDRRSGFLPPSIYDSKNLGIGLSIPYFFAVDEDKNFTLTNRLYVSENPLFFGEYHQVFKGASFLADFGFTDGYKNTSASKKPGQKSHLFAKFVKNFKGKNESENTLSLSVQDVSNDKYLKLYKIKSNLVDYNKDTLESVLNFTHESDDIFFGLNASVYETLKENYEDKYEFILPEITLDKNLFNNDRLGNLDLQTNVKIHNYDTNKLTSFIVNDFNWESKEKLFNSGVNTKLLANIKNVNYEAKNVEPYKESATSEVYGALGLLADLKLFKKYNNSSHFFTPKLLLRGAPGSMRKETSGPRLDPISAYSLKRLDNQNNFETGASGTIGFDYKIKGLKNDFDFSVAQIINERENIKMSDKSSLNEKLSDLVGSASLNLNNKFKVNYNFSLDQNYNDLNYNEIGTNFDIGGLKLDLNFLQEKKHVGNQEYFKTKVDFNNQENSLFSFETKRNLITNSAEFYNLSYEYTNDCLRAGLVYRREFYNDSELEPENSLMFKLTLTPFGNINSPTFSK